MSTESNLGATSGPNEPWRSYKEGGTDGAGRTILEISAKSSAFIIYTTAGKAEPSALPWRKPIEVEDYHVEGTDAARANLAEANVLVTKIHPLAPRKSRHRVVIDKQLACAYETALRGNLNECKIILEDILDQLTSTQIAKGQLRYMVTNVIGCFLAWIGFCVQLHRKDSCPTLTPWLLAGTLGGHRWRPVRRNQSENDQYQCVPTLVLAVLRGLDAQCRGFFGGFICLVAIRAKIALGDCCCS